jgi:hypothetical protein
MGRMGKMGRMEHMRRDERINNNTEQVADQN